MSAPENESANRPPDEQNRPKFIYGTAWKEDETAPLVRLALQAGFRAIDTANQRKHYHEAAVGEALAAAVADGVVTRDELFLQTKFTHRIGHDHRLPYDADAPLAQQVTQSFESSLEHLQTDFIDAYLLHGPSTRAGFTAPDREVWEAMQELLRSRRLGALGVSNVTAEQLQTLLEWADHPPAFVQNRCFARSGWDRQVRAICKANGIVYQGFSLLTANVRELNTPEMARIAQRHERTLPQIVFCFARQVGMVPLTGTTNEQHMAQDLAVSDFGLEDAEVRTVEEIALR